MAKPAPPPPPPPPAISAQIINAKKVFVSNLGEDAVATANLPGGADACYNTFYASLEQWGHYQLVSSPKDADLIFEISATKKAEIDREILSPGPRPDKYDVTRYPAIITLAAKRTDTGSPLWTTQVGFLSTANTRKTELKQFNEAIEALTNRLKAMAPVASPAPAP
jgi:hypothetical protein